MNVRRPHRNLGRNSSSLRGLIATVKESLHALGSIGRMECQGVCETFQLGTRCSSGRRVHQELGKPNRLGTA